ncbi:MAG: WXG100 family type VII secretion target [Ectobacillus sp.]
MSRLHVVPDELEKAARQFTAASEEGQRIAQKLYEMRAHTIGNWEGNKQQQFLEQLQQCTQALNAYLQGLADASTKLKQTATKFRQADQ